MGDIITGIVQTVANVVDDFIYTDEERADTEAKREAARAQAELAKAQREAAMYQAQAAQYQALGESTEAKGKILMALVFGGALIGAALVWKGMK